MPSMLINSPNGYQKPLEGGSFQKIRIQKKSIRKVQKNLRKIPTIPREISAQRSSTTLKKLGYKKHHKVIEVP